MPSGSVEHTLVDHMHQRPEVSLQMRLGPSSVLYACISCRVRLSRRKGSKLASTRKLWRISAYNCCDWAAQPASGSAALLTISASLSLALLLLSLTYSWAFPLASASVNALSSCHAAATSAAGLTAIQQQQLLSVKACATALAAGVLCPMCYTPIRCGLRRWLGG
eukprot:GHUV01034392.1.p1 GENE.GHUV01034392.1~~GHUV01034392.1.p1  ORF type:complete len:165 (-),score=17.27 GHUV01034392.1:261-755(-)